MNRDYQRFVTPDSTPYDPIKLAKRTAQLVSDGLSRKYTAFYCTGVYGGISTGYTVGCCLRCIFCWVDWSRDYPEGYGDFYSPGQVFDNLVKNAKAKRVSKLRVSGGEPTLCKEHLLEVLELVAGTNFLFILETNGLVLGEDRGFAEALKSYPNIHLRVSLKAGTAEGFQARTGARGAFYELPFKAVRNLLDSGLSFHVATMSDARLMPRDERMELIRKLRAIGYNDYLEEELCDPYPHTIARLEYAGLKV